MRFSAQATQRRKPAIRFVEFGGRYLSRLTLGYRPNDRRRMSIALDNVRGGNDILRETETTLNGAPLSSQSNLNEVEFYNDQINLDFQQDGGRPRQQLRANSMFQWHGVDFEQTFGVTPVVGVSKPSGGDQQRRPEEHQHAARIRYSAG